MKTPLESRALAKLHPLQFVGGSKTLYIVSHDGKVQGAIKSTNQHPYYMHLHFHRSLPVGRGLVVDWA